MQNLKAIYLFLVLFFLMQGFLFTQQPTEVWVARYTGPTNDIIGPFMQVDKLGNMECPQKNGQKIKSDCLVFQIAQERDNSV